MLSNDIKSNNVAIVKLIKTKWLSVNYAKTIHSLVILMKITKHVSLKIMVSLYRPSFDCGYLSLGFEFNYRLKNIDHKGIGLIISLILLKIEIECSDDRHIEDYKGAKL